MNSAADLITALIRARRARGWTQQHVADLIGVSRPRLCDWENQRIDPGLSNYLRWATALDLVVLAEPVPAGVL